jgi:TonB family protein
VIQSRPAMLRTSAILVAMLSGALLAAQDSKPFPAPASPGNAIQDSAQASVHDIPHPLAPGLEILTDTRGVDFGPYLLGVKSRVQKNWYNLIPANAVSKKGKLLIEFKIRPDGGVADMKLASASGDVSLDRAAWAGISSAGPFPHLPSDFTGPYLALRFRFYYNPEASDIVPGEGDSIVPATVQQDVTNSDLPKYPKKALEDKIEGIVRLVVEIAPDGTVESAAAVEGDPLLTEVASEAIRKWRFRPVQADGKPLEYTVRIRVDFRLDGEQVRARAVGSETPPSATLAP